MPTVVLKKEKPTMVNKPALNVKNINPFIIAAVSVIKETSGLSVAKENIFVQKGKFTPSGTGMALDLNGTVKGRVVYEFSKGVAARISQKIVERNIDMSTSAMDFKEMLNSAILELGNQITGKAITLLEKEGISCTISPPKFYLGSNLQLIHPHLKTIVLNLKTEFGNFSINIALYN